MKSVSGHEGKNVINFINAAVCILGENIHGNHSTEYFVLSAIRRLYINVLFIPFNSYFIVKYIILNI